MTLQFPTTWMQMTLDPKMAVALRNVCSAPVVAMTARSMDLKDSTLLDQQTFLCSALEGYDTFLWSALNEPLKRKIAYDVMEVQSFVLSGQSIARQAQRIIEEDDGGPDDPSYLILITDVAVTLVNESRIQEFIEAHDDIIAQELLDEAMLTLVFQHEEMSAHKLISIQKKVHDLQILILRYLFPREIDISLSHLPLPQHKRIL